MLMPTIGEEGDGSHEDLRACVLKQDRGPIWARHLAVWDAAEGLLHYRSGDTSRYHGDVDG